MVLPEYFSEPAPTAVASVNKPVLKDGMESFIIHDRPKDAEDITFKNSQDEATRLSAFRGTAPDRQGFAFSIEIGPLQLKQLAPAEPRVDGEQDHGL